MIPFTVPSRLGFLAIASAAGMTIAACPVRAEDAPDSNRTDAPARPAPTAVSTAGSPSELSETDRRVLPLIDEGFFQARVGNHARAVQSFEQALAIEATNSRALFGIGTSYISLERYEEATNHLYRAIRLASSNDHFAVNNLAWLHATARDIRYRDGAKAIELARQALVLAPLDYHIWSTLAEGYYISGDYEKARRAAEEALKIARSANLPEQNLQEYESQVRRCRSAAEAMDILE